MSAAIAPKRAAVCGASIVCSGCAVRVNVLPTATPTRRVPKSNARIVASDGSPTRGSPVARGIGQPRDPDAEQAHSGGPPALRRQAEQHVGLRFDGEPSVPRALLLELPRAPAGLA